MEGVICGVDSRTCEGKNDLDLLTPESLLP